MALSSKCPLMNQYHGISGLMKRTNMTMKQQKLSIPKSGDLTLLLGMIKNYPRQMAKNVKKKRNVFKKDRKYSRAMKMIMLSELALVLLAVSMLTKQIWYSEKLDLLNKSLIGMKELKIIQLRPNNFTRKCSKE